MAKRWIALVVVAVWAMANAASAQIRVSPARHEFRFHGALGPGPGHTVSQFGATVTLANAAGAILSVTLPAGACVDHGTGCLYENSQATAATGGIARFRMKFSTGKIWMVSYGDLTAAGTARMSVNVVIPSTPFQDYSITANFTPTKKGWLLPDNDPQW
jgi:hypothetical protein